ncbi:transposable element Tcb1 transposase [Trichonephila clavipes]|nr:transposable element Tcb1 transposase [Trichonephila clavipes]
MVLRNNSKLHMRICMCDDFFHKDAEHSCETKTLQAQCSHVLKSFIRGWLVWGGNILGSRTDLHVQSVTMTSHIYRDVILEQHVCLFRGAICAEFLFMDDNARPHRANIVDECLQSEYITRMNWPAYSPDLSPIEHVLCRRITACQPPPTILPKLRRALLDEWRNIPQDEVDNLILSMPRRCKACIASSGGHTPY